MKILIVIGTRPEAIKMGPVVAELGKESSLVVEVCSTGQHEDMLAPAMAMFGIKPKWNLGVMKSASGSPEVTAEVIRGVSHILKEFKPDMVLVHGDTSSAVGGALAAFQSNIALGHIEAGLRSGNLGHPHPEEGHRRVIDHISTLLFAPTDLAKKNLLNERCEKKNIFVTGNTVVDALSMIQSSNRNSKRVFRTFRKTQHEKLILATVHRREAFASGIESIFSAFAKLVAKNRDIRIVVPMHPNPVVRRAVSNLSGMDRIDLIEPLDYRELVHLMGECDLVLTDSGGIQEEAPILGRFTLVLRETTERPEAINAGMAELVGFDTNKIVERAEFHLANSLSGAENSISPFGDGKSSARIRDILLDWAKMNLGRISKAS
jgi:UDP-N-acetylglucosamine 2-epimerase (non-hydrolysing)